ncbi:hypothetical protein JOD43_000399 [Pullulanibacillus pueri]|nr:hypothetical protein [Pullulanibacillus pueri]
MQSEEGSCPSPKKISGSADTDESSPYSARRYQPLLRR